MQPVELTPASLRPYIGGSQDNSVLNLVFGYNGFGRLNGNEAGSVGGSGPVGSRWGATGLLRMFNADRRHFHHVVSEKYGSIGKAIIAIWFVTLLFAVAAVLTVMPSTKAEGYLIGAAGVLVMLFFRYWFRRGEAVAAAGTQI